MKKLAVILLGVSTTTALVSAVEINERGQVCFQPEKARIVQFADALSVNDIQEEQWQPAGDENAVAAISGTDRLRFYRIVAEGESSPPHYALGTVKLFAGMNWVGLWGDPVVNTLTGIFGSRLPAGMSFTLAEDETGISPGVSAVKIELPQGSETVELPVILKIPGESVEQLVSYGKRTLGGFRFPGRPRLDQAGLLEGGFTGGPNPVESDQLWKYDRRNQRAPYAVWFCTKDNTWRLTIDGPDFPVVPPDAFRYDDAVMVMPRQSVTGIRWRKAGAAQ